MINYINSLSSLYKNKYYIKYKRFVNNSLLFKQMGKMQTEQFKRIVSFMMTNLIYCY